MVTIFVLDGITVKTGRKVHVALSTKCRVSESENSDLAGLVARLVYQKSKANILNSCSFRNPFFFGAVILSTSVEDLEK